jgi:uncharacterized protein (TIGR03435 family)
MAILGLRKMKLCAGMGLCVAALVVAMAGAQESAKPAQAAGAAPVQTAAQGKAEVKDFRYEVVSIRPSDPKATTSMMATPANEFRMTNMPLNSLVRGAYSVVMESDIVGLPKWAESDRYDVQAKMDDETVEALKKLSRAERNRQQRQMMLAVLEERCHFKAHLEKRVVPAYDLVVDAGGVKMKEMAAGAKPSGRYSSGKIEATGETAEGLAFSLSGTVGRRIIDKTGLGNKRFDVELKWTPDDQQGTADAGPSIYAALKEQLGLKLVPSKTEVEVVVVERMERPTEN